MTAFHSSDTSPLGQNRSRLEALVERFEDAWARGQRPIIEEYLPHDDPDRQLALVELIHTELEYRLKAGDPARVEEYLQRFPCLADIPGCLIDLIAKEFTLRRRTEAGLARAEFLERFPQYAGDLAGRFAELETSGPHDDVSTTLAQPQPPSNTQPALRPMQPPENHQGTRIRCPHCHNPIQLIHGQSEEVLCPGCGSTFRLREARATDTHATMRPLGKFQLLERVGVGAFGAVWKARDTELDRIVALKIPHSGLFSQSEELERFHREARATAQLRHPGIVTVHEIQKLEGLPSIVSEFVEGVSLRDWMESRKLTFRESAVLLAEIAEALDYAHEMGVVHRETIKGVRNLLCDRKPTLKKGS